MILVEIKESAVTLKISNVVFVLNYRAIALNSTFNSFNPFIVSLILILYFTKFFGNKLMKLEKTI